jgi:hypothetical protein
MSFGILATYRRTPARKLAYVATRCLNRPCPLESCLARGYRPLESNILARCNQSYPAFVPILSLPSLLSGLLIVILAGIRTPAPAPAASSSAAVRLARASVGLAGRRPHKGKVDVDGLVQELRLVCAVYGSARFLQGRVLDESIALKRASPVSFRKLGLQTITTFRMRGEKTCLDITTTSVQVEVEVLDLAVVAKLILQGLLVGLLVHIGDHYDPALDRTDGCGICVRLHVPNLGLGGLGGAGLVHLHLNVGHGVSWWCGFLEAAA